MIKNNNYFMKEKIKIHNNKRTIYKLDLNNIINVELME